MNAEIFTLIDPKSARLEYAGHGHGGITKFDVMAAMAGADETGLNLLLAQVCNNRQAQSEAFYRLYSKVMDLAIKQNWQRGTKRGRERIRALTQLAIYEHVATPRCPKCHGTKYNRAMRPCKPCDGTGYYKIRNSHRARAMGIRPSTWSRVWAGRYAEIEHIINDAESRALRTMFRRLTQRED